jgi:hypothetical protein
MLMALWWGTHAPVGNTSITAPLVVLLLLLLLLVVLRGMLLHWQQTSNLPTTGASPCVVLLAWRVGGRGP